MSLWDDYEAEAQFASDYPHGVNGDEWTTKDGRRLTLSEMTDDHIKNVMRMIGQNDDFWYRCEWELNKRKQASADYKKGYKQGKNDAVVHSYWDYEDRFDPIAHCHHCGNESDMGGRYCNRCGALMDAQVGAEK